MRAALPGLWADLSGPAGYLDADLTITDIYDPETV
jgi:hypothetical protein